VRIEVRDDDCWRPRPRVIDWLVVLHGEIALEAAPAPRDGLPCPAVDNLRRLRAAVWRGRVWAHMGWPRLYNDPEGAAWWDLPGLGNIGGILFGRVVPDHGDYDVRARDVVPEDDPQPCTPCVVVPAAGRG
jgi:hypothetical protein